MKSNQGKGGRRMGLSSKTKRTSRELLLYLLRWQASTPILAVCLTLLSGLGNVWATVIANLVGGLVFFWIDRLIFKVGD